MVDTILFKLSRIGAWIPDCMLEIASGQAAHIGEEQKGQGAICRRTHAVDCAAIDGSWSWPVNPSSTCLVSIAHFMFVVWMTKDSTETLLFPHWNMDMVALWPGEGSLGSEWTLLCPLKVCFGDVLKNHLIYLVRCTHMVCSFCSTPTSVAQLVACPFAELGVLRVWRRQKTPRMLGR